MVAEDAYGNEEIFVTTVPEPDSILEPKPDHSQGMNDREQSQDREVGGGVHGREVTTDASAGPGPSF